MQMFHFAWLMNSKIGGKLCYAFKDKLFSPILMEESQGYLILHEEAEHLVLHAYLILDPLFILSDS